MHFKLLLRAQDEIAENIVVLSAAKVITNCGLEMITTINGGIKK